MSDNMNVTPYFICAGEATFTVANGKDHYTYHIYKGAGEQSKGAYFAKVMTGNDNTDVMNGYRYIGMLFPYPDSFAPPKLIMTKKSSLSIDSPRVKILQWALRVIWQQYAGEYELPTTHSIQHAGRCGKCGAKLTNPESLNTGLGPDCAAQLGVYTTGYIKAREQKATGTRKGDLPRQVHIINEHTSSRDFELARQDLVGFFTRRL